MNVGTNISTSLFCSAGTNQPVTCDPPNISGFFETLFRLAPVPLLSSRSSSSMIDDASCVLLWLGGVTAGPHLDRSKGDTVEPQPHAAASAKFCSLSHLHLSLPLASSQRSQRPLRPPFPHHPPPFSRLRPCIRVTTRTGSRYYLSSTRTAAHAYQAHK